MFLIVAFLWYVVIIFVTTYATLVYFGFNSGLSHRTWHCHVCATSGVSTLAKYKYVMVLRKASESLQTRRTCMASDIRGFRRRDMKKTSLEI